jgi:hypothetical protein
LVGLKLKNWGGGGASHHWIWRLFFFCKTTFAKRPRHQALYSILFKQVLAAMEFGNQTLAAKPYDGQGIELIFLKTSYSFEKRFLI